MRWQISFCAVIPLFSFFACGHIFAEQENNGQRIDFLVDLITHNLKTNGWSHFISAGLDFPDSFYDKIRSLPLTFTFLRSGIIDQDMDNIVRYYSNIVLLHCKDFDGFEDALRKAMASPYWHPHANTILYYHEKGQDDIPNIFIIFWFYKICNAVVIQYDNDGYFLASYFNPYVGENYKLQYQFGCWKTTKLGRTVGKFQKSFKCVDGCHNVTIHSKLRNMFLGTCIGYETVKIKLGDMDTLKRLNLFEDKGNNLHGFILKGFGGEVFPFVMIKENSDGNYSLQARDGMLWNLAAERMNFSIDLSASKDSIKKPFNFEVNIQQIFSFARRQADLLVFPVYQFDIVIVEIDMSVAYKDSGVCIVAHRAGFETVLFDAKLLEENTELVAKFLVSFLMIWVLFFVFNIIENGRISFDQAGKDLVNTIRNVLSISLHKPPKRGTFRIYLGISMWCFFIFNFATQAAIISFFTAYKRGKEVETFEDILEKGYVIEGMASPDMVLPDDNELFRKVNAKLVSIPTLYGCIDAMANDSRRFCLIDCSVGHYLERNLLNENGQQFLHVSEDRIHSHYLVMILHKHSPLTNSFNKCTRRAIEGGLIKKWEGNRFSDMIEEVPIKALSLEDLIGIFKCYYLLLGLSSCVFFIELLINFMKRAINYFREKNRQWKRTYIAKRKQQAERKLGPIKTVNISTQTV